MVTPRLYAVSIYQMAPHQIAPSERGSTRPITAYYLFIDLVRMKG